MQARRLQLRQNDSLLILILPLAICVAYLADLVRLEEQYLAEPFVRIDPCRQWRRVRDLQRYKSLPLWLERRDVHNNSTPRIRRLTHADRQHIPRILEILN